MAKNPGQIVEVVDGLHKGKRGVALNRDQHTDIVKKGKLLVELVDSGKVLIDAKFLKLTGFVD